MTAIKFPALLFTGEAATIIEAKTAVGVFEWRPERCVGFLSFNSAFDIAGLPHLSIEDAAASGAKTLIIGCAPHDGKIKDSWRDTLIAAMEAGLDIACGLHTRLGADTEMAALADQLGVRIIDFRHRDVQYPKGTGLPREGYRVLTVGTDCSCGKKYTALSMYQAHKRSVAPLRPVFCSTGQTGYLISDNGINNDTIVADFLSGAAESLSPSDRDAVYFIEGQGSLLHPSYCGGSLSLIKGSQPDALVLCHAVGRTVRDGLPSARIASLREEHDLNLLMARTSNASCEVVAISLNFNEAGMTHSEVAAYIDAVQSEFPTCRVFDPRAGIDVGFIDELNRKAQSKRDSSHG